MIKRGEFIKSMKIFLMENHKLGILIIKKENICAA